MKKFDITTEAHALELEGENVVSKRGCGLGHGPGIGLLREVNVERCAEEANLDSIRNAQKVSSCAVFFGDREIASRFNGSSTLDR